MSEPVHPDAGKGELGASDSKGSEASQADGGDSLEASQSTCRPPENYTAEEKQMAQAAASAFGKNHLEDCLSCLQQLTNTHSGDWVLQLNRAVVEYARSGYVRTEDFRQSLNAVAAAANASFDSGVELDEPDHAILLYNYAIILFYQRQYQEAKRILEAMQPLSEPLEPAFYRALTLLLLNTLLKLQRPDAALAVVNDSEKIMYQPAGADAALTADRPKAELSVLKTCALLMRRDLAAAKQQLKQLRELGLDAQPLLFLKSHAQYLRGNYRKALQIVRSIPSSLKSPTETGECETVMQWNNLGCVHFHLGKHNLGAFYLRRAIKENEKVCSEYQAKKVNGKGGHVLHHQIPLRAYSISRHYELLHNLGLQLLFSGKPVQAFDFLLEVINVYPRNPRLWLRLAECCITHQRPSNSVDRDFEIRQRAVQGTVGSGRHRKLLLGTGVQEIKKPWEESAAMPTPTLEFASLCVRNALLLLPQEPKRPAADPDYRDHVLRWADGLCVPLNPAGFLRGRQVVQFRSSVLTSAAYIALCLCDHLSALHYSEQLLRQPCLSDCQVYLGRMYLAEAKVYLQVPEHNSKDFLNDAIGLLNPSQVTSVDITPPSVPQPPDCPGKKEPAGDPIVKWTPSTTLEAQNMMKYNLSVVYAIKGDYDQARQCLQDVVYNPRGLGMTPPFPAHFYFFKLYLDLMQGRRSFAQLLLKETFGHLTPNPYNWRSKAPEALPPQPQPQPDAAR